MEARSNVELINQTTFDFVPFRGRKVLSGGDCNNPENLGQFKIFILAILANFDYLKWIILNNIDEKFILNIIRTYILYTSSLEYIIIIYNYKRNWKWRGSSIIRFQNSIECTGCKINQILVKPKIIGSIWEYISNESEKSKFHSGNQKICPVENSE